MLLPLAMSLELFLPFSPCHSRDFSLCPAPTCKHTHAPHPLTTSEVASPAHTALFPLPTSFADRFPFLTFPWLLHFLPFASTPHRPASPALSKAVMMPASGSLARSWSSSSRSHVTLPSTLLPSCRSFHPFAHSQATLLVQFALSK